MCNVGASGDVWSVALDAILLFELVFKPAAHTNSGEGAITAARTRHPQHPTPLASVIRLLVGMCNVGASGDVWWMVLEAILLFELVFKPAAHTNQGEGAITAATTGHPWLPTP